MSKYGAIEICEKYGLNINHYHANSDGNTQAPQDTHVRRPGKTSTITCVDCGGERKVLVQDLFHVKRCKSCQVKYARMRGKVMGAAEEFRKKLVKEKSNDKK